MVTFEEFEHSLQDALLHLYDPTFQPDDTLWQVTGCVPAQGVESLQTALLKAIDDLKPTSDIPPNARIRRLHEVLLQRYVSEKTQAEAAEQLGITTRHLRREQGQAVQVLARRLWEHRPAPPAPPPTSGNSTHAVPSPANDDDSQAWRSQVRQELSSLEQNAPGIVADVVTAIAGAAKSGQALASPQNVQVQTAPIDGTLMAIIHPSVLRQVLILAVQLILERMDGGEISMAAQGTKNNRRVKITISGSLAGESAEAIDFAPSDFICEAVTAQGGTVTPHTGDGRLALEVVLPSARNVTVLVVDDNADLVHFYRRYTARTRYQIQHLAAGQQLFETIAKQRPDVIVLDIMLPDVDGWELLTNLHEHPDTRDIPVIVCSVIKQQELAMALGAALYVAKPVRRRALIEALDQATNQAQAASQTT